jgi:hypothetical protein
MPGGFEHPLMIGDLLVMRNAVVLGQRDDDKPARRGPLGNTCRPRSRSMKNVSPLAWPLGGVGVDTENV